MTYQTKRIIAREILLLACSGLLAVIIFLLVYPYNWFYQSKISSVEKNIQNESKIADSLGYSYLSKQKKQNWFFDENAKEGDVSKELNTSNKLWILMEDLLKSDSIEYRYSNVWNKTILIFLNRIGFNSGKMFKDFIQQNSITEKDIENKKKAVIIENEIAVLDSKKNNYENKILSFDEQRVFSLKVFILILIILYPIRLFYLVVLWAIKILKQRN